MRNQEHSFTFAEVATVARMSTTAITQWARRGKLVMRNDDRASLGRGVERRMSLETSIQAVIMAELSRRGVGLDTASRAALSFAHTGNEYRNPSEIFSGGRTMLAVNDFGPHRHRLFCITDETTYGQMQALMHPVSDRDEGVVLLDISEILIRAYAAWHLDYGKLLDRMHADDDTNNSADDEEGNLLDA